MSVKSKFAKKSIPIPYLVLTKKMLVSEMELVTRRFCGWAGHFKIKFGQLTITTFWAFSFRMVIFLTNLRILFAE